MNARDKDKLLRHRTYLVENVNIDGLLTPLLTKKTITQRIKASIERAGSIFQQVEALLDTLARGGPKAFNDFCDALKENNQDYIVAYLENDECSKPEKAAQEKDDAECIKLFTFTDENNHIVNVPIAEVPHLSNKRYQSMPALSPTKRNCLDTRYTLKHFLSMPENYVQDLDQIPIKLTKRDSVDIYPNPGEISCSKKQKLMEDLNIQNEYNDEDLTNEIIMEKTTRKFYFEHYKNAYKMDRIPRGQALIININQISGMPSRKGSDIDASNLLALLQQLHFVVTTYGENNMTAKNIDHEVYKFAQMPEHKSADATVVCFLSHGDDGHIYGTDGQQVALNTLFSYFDNANCPNLQDKPKIFIIQACRGVRVDHRTPMVSVGDLTPPVEESDGPHTLTSSSSLVCAPTKSDMIICYPTQQGYRAWRNREQGSWFVQAIVKVFMKHACFEDICAMMNRVNNMVSQKMSNCADEKLQGTMQMSEYQSSLRKPYLYFFPGVGSK